MWISQEWCKILEQIVLVQKIKIEDKIIEIVKNWPESKFVPDIQTFLKFANFY